MKIPWSCSSRNAVDERGGVSAKQSIVLVCPCDVAVSSVRPERTTGLHPLVGEPPRPVESQDGVAVELHEKAGLLSLEFCDGSLVWSRGPGQCGLARARADLLRRSHPHLNRITTEVLERGVAASTKPHPACSDHPGTAKASFDYCRKARTFRADTALEKGGGNAAAFISPRHCNDIMSPGQRLACAQAEANLPRTLVGVRFAWLVRKNKCRFISDEALWPPHRHVPCTTGVRACANLQ